MGYTRKSTKAELRQHELNQQATDYLEWLAEMDSELARFFTEDAPEVAELPDRWSAEGLRIAGAAAAAAFADIQTLYAPENRQIVDRFVRFVGEVYRRSFEGCWLNVPACGPEGVEFWPIINRPATGYIDPRDQLGSVFAKPKVDPYGGKGGLVWVYDNSAEDYRNWVAAGRPGFDVWEQMQFDALLESAKDYDV